MNLERHSRRPTETAPLMIVDDFEQVVTGLGKCIYLSGKYLPDNWLEAERRLMSAELNLMENAFELSDDEVIIAENAIEAETIRTNLYRMAIDLAIESGILQPDFALALENK